MRFDIFMVMKIQVRLQDCDTMK